jgi:hypothetical protein
MNATEWRLGGIETFLRRENERGSSDAPVSDSAADHSPPDREEPTGAARSAVLPAVVGGMAGAVFAVGVVLAMTALRPPLDPRLPGLAQQVGGMQQSLNTLETALRRAEVDLVRALVADAGMAKQIDQQTASIKAAMTDIAEARRQLQVETGPGSVVFGVSVVQMADAVASGRPFESEWVNLYALTDGHEPLRQELRRLMPMAAAGALTPAALQAELRAIAAAAGTPVIDRNDLYLYGLNLVRSGLGLLVGTTTERHVITNLVTEADRHLAEGDLAGALAALANLTKDAVMPFRAWIAAAQQRAAADAAVAELTRVSWESLRARAKGVSG